MMAITGTCSRGIVLAVSIVLPAVWMPLNATAALAQAPAASPAARQLGTVKVISGNSLTIVTDAGQQYAVTVAEGARIVQLAPGSTDLKSAQVITLPDIGVGDRVLVSGKAGETPDSFAASRVILMKSGDIAQKHATEQADWQKRGTGGIVTTVGAASGTLTISAGAKKIQVQTTDKTIFRRYAGDSIKFEDAKPGTLSQVQSGDQLEVRGAKSDDGTSIQAEEVVSGSFRNVSGTLATINPTAGTVTLKDLTTKKMVTVSITANSDLRKLPADIAARFAARAHNVSASSPGGAPAAGAPRQNAPAGQPAGQPSGGTGAGPANGQERSAGMDLSKMLSRLPNTTLAELHTGDAVMIVGSQSQPGSDTVTAVTLLSGVEPILAATPNGSMTLSPWNVGGDAPGGGAQ